MSADVVQVWLAEDDVPDPVLERLNDLLDAEERYRAAAYLRPRDRRRFVVAHALARSVVGERLGVPARRVRWRVGGNGKPHLAWPRTGIEVNLSHSRNLCAVALSDSRPVGVDVQHIAPGMDVAAMARRYYSPPETAFVLSPASGTLRSRRFTQLWARKEALVKAAGSRLLRAMPVCVLTGPGGGVVEFEDGAHRIADLRAPAGFRAAVALRGAQPYQVVEHWWSSE
jgi:4'-phosphopantetheinyl transferase